jgi:hypothetical protein
MTARSCFSVNFASTLWSAKNSFRGTWWAILVSPLYLAYLLDACFYYDIKTPSILRFFLCLSWLTFHWFLFNGNLRARRLVTPETRKYMLSIQGLGAFVLYPQTSLYLHKQIGVYGSNHTVSRLTHLAVIQFSISNHKVPILNSRATHMAKSQLTSTQAPKTVDTCLISGPNISSRAQTCHFRVGCLDMLITA